MRQSYRAVAGHLQRGVADAIGLERRAPFVEGPTVELDRKTVLGPDAVNLEAGHIHVDRRRRQVGLPAQVEEVPLEI